MQLSNENINQLSKDELVRLRSELQEILKERDVELEMMDKKIRIATFSEHTTHSDITPLINHREEIKQQYNFFNSKLALVESRLNSNGRPAGEFVNDVVRASVGNGVTDIRADDSKNKAVAGAKTYEQILEEKKIEKSKQENQSADKVRSLEQRLERLEKSNGTKEADKTSAIKK